MSAKWRLGLGLSMVVAAGLGACGSVDCPAGTTSVDGRCMGADDACVPTEFAPDEDGDGYGDARGVRRSCTAPAGYVADATDCDDANADVHPGAAETCDGVDEDCDGAADQTFACVAGATVACTTECGSMGTTTCSASCELARTCALPEESCNGADDDCDGGVDEGVMEFGERVLLGASNGRVRVLPAGDGFLALWSDTAVGSEGVFGQRVNADGLVGEPTTLRNAGASDFAADVLDDTVYVLTYGSGVTGYRFAAADLSAVGSPTSLGVGGTIAGASVVANAAGLTTYYSTGTSGFSVSMVESGIAYESPTHRDFSVGPGFGPFGSTGPAIAVARFGEQEAFAAANGAALPILGLHAHGAPGDVSLLGGATGAASSVAIAAGADHVGVVYHRHTASADEVVLLVLTESSGFLTVRDTYVLSTALPSERSIGAMGLAYANERFYATWFERVDGTTSSWKLAEIDVPADGGGISHSTRDVEAAPAANLGASITAGADGSILVAANRSDGAARAYRLGCF